MSIHKANMTEVFVVTVAIGAWNVVVWVVVEIKVYTAQGHREGPEPHHTIGATHQSDSPTSGSGAVPTCANKVVPPYNELS